MPSSGFDPPGSGHEPPAEAGSLKWWLGAREGVDDAQDRDIERSCASKDGYPTESHARAIAAMNGMSGVLFTYECRYCRSWHLTRREPPAKKG